MKSTEDSWTESCRIYIKLYSNMECTDLKLAPLTNRTPAEVNGLEAKQQISSKYFHQAQGGEKNWLLVKSVQHLSHANLSE